VEKQVLKLKDRVGTVAIECPDEGAEITIDGRPVGVTPLAEPVMVSVGRRTIVAKLGGRKVDQVVEVGGRDALTITLELPTGATPPDGSTSEPTGDTTTLPDEGGTETGSPDGDDGLSTGVIVAWAATGVLAVAAVATGVGALASSGELADQRDTLGVDPEELESTSDRVFALGLTTDILIGAAAVMAGVSVYLTLTDGDDGEEPANQTRFVVSPFGVGLTGSF